MPVSAAWAETITITETLPNNVDSVDAAKRVVTHDAFNESGLLNAGSAVPATLTANFVMALVSGAKTIDLRALTGTNGGAVDLNGLKVQLLRIKNLGANPMTFVPGASNGIALLGTGFSLTVQPGQVAMFMLNDQAPDVGSSAKAVDVTGTGTQTAEITVVAG